MPPLPMPPSVPDMYLFYHLLIPPLFGWLLCLFLSIGVLLEPMCYLFSFNFVIPIVTRIDGMTPPPPPALQTGRATSQTSLLPRTPTVGWLLCLHFKFWPLNAKAPFPVYFSTCVVLGPPNKPTNVGATEPDHGRLAWDHGMPRHHGVLWSLLTYP